MSFLWSAIDESTDVKRRHVFVVSGWVSLQSIWTEVERHWQQRLDKDSIAYFKSSECGSLSKQFRKFRNCPDQTGRAKADEVFDDLALMLRSSKLYGFVLVIDLKDFRNSRKSSRTRSVLVSDDPYVFAYQTLLVRIGCYVTKMKKPQTVAFLCDHHDKYKQLYEGYNELKKKNPDCAKYMGSLTEMLDQKSPALQTADLLASVCQRAYVRLKKGDIDQQGFVEEVKAKAGKNVGVGLIDRHIIRLATEANLLKDGKPSPWSTAQRQMFNEAWVYNPT
jgi:hypothetical protein